MSRAKEGGIEDSELKAFATELENQGFKITDFGDIIKRNDDAYIDFCSASDENVKGTLVLEKAEYEGTPGRYRWELRHGDGFTKGEGKGSDTLSIN